MLHCAAATSRARLALTEAWAPSWHVDQVWGLPRRALFPGQVPQQQIQPLPELSLADKIAHIVWPRAQVTLTCGGRF